MGVIGNNPDNTAHTRSGGYTTQVSSSKTRPNNTTAYAAGDVINESTSVGTIITFTNTGRTEGNSGIITASQIIDSANQTTKPQLALWLFNNAPTTVNDNAAFAPSDAELESGFIGVVNFSDLFVGNATSGAGGNYLLQTKNENLVFECVDGSRDIYGILQVLNAYTPVANEKFTVTLGLFQD